MKLKMNLKALNVSSFVTSMNEEKSETLKGGTGGLSLTTNAINPQTLNPQTLNQTTVVAVQSCFCKYTLQILMTNGPDCQETGPALC